MVTKYYPKNLEEELKLQKKESSEGAFLKSISKSSITKNFFSTKKIRSMDESSRYCKRYSKRI